MKIDPRQLANLLSIAEHGSFNRAAAARGLSQPAMSNSIAQLERRIGAPVLDRGRRGSQLSEIGRILVRNAQAVESILTQAADEVRHRRRGVEGPLRVGAVPSVTLKFLPEVMQRLLKPQAPVAVTLVEGMDDDLLPALQSGTLDVVIAPLAGIFPPPSDIVEDPLFEDPFSIGVGPRHSLKNRSSVTLGELRDHPWVVPMPGSSYRRHVEALFLTAGVPWPLNCVTTSSLTLVESIVAQNERVAIITDIQTRMQNTWRIRSVPLKGGGKRSIGCKWRKAGKMAPAAVQLVKACHEVADAAPRPARVRR